MDVQHKSLDKTFDFYQLITYMQILLYSMVESKKTFLQNALWYKDTQGMHDTIIRHAVNSPGENARSTMSAVSRKMHLQGRILVDSLNFARPLVENVSLTLQFVPHAPEGCLLAEYPSSIYPPVSRSTFHTL